MTEIPERITYLISELSSGRNDGYTDAGMRKELKEIRDYIDEALTKLTGGNK